MLGRPGLLDAGRNVIDPVAGHLAALFFKPTDEAIAMDKDDVLAIDPPRLELVPEDDNGLDPSNAGLLRDVLL
jgi:hypothetical protein